MYSLKKKLKPFFDRLYSKLYHLEPQPRKSIQDGVAEDILLRKSIGMRKYGSYLYPHNGRDMLLDAYEEALDLCCYLKGAIMEREAKGK